MSLNKFIEIRQLHSPVEMYGELKCDGCDYDGWESEPPAWPCRTAVIVYTKEQIDETRRDFENYETWYRQAQERKYCRSLAPSVIGRAFSIAFDNGRLGDFIADKVFPVIPLERNTITFRREEGFTK